MTYRNLPPVPSSFTGEQGYYLRQLVTRLNGEEALGSVAWASGSTVVRLDQRTVLVSGSGTVTLPDPSVATYRVLTIKNMAPSTVTVDGAGFLIDGAPTVAIPTQYASRTVQSTGTMWVLV